MAVMDDHRSAAAVCVHISDPRAAWRRYHRASGSAAAASEAYLQWLTHVALPTGADAIDAHYTHCAEVEAAIAAAIAAEKDVPPLAAASPLPHLGDLERIAPRPELVRGIIRQGEVALLVGATKARKSWLAIDLCLSIAGGRHWLGTLATAQCQALYIDAECPPSVVGERVRILEGDRQTYARERVAYSSRRSAPPRHALEAVDMLAAEISVSGAQVAVVDTLSAYWPIADENDNAEATQVIGHIVRVAEEYQCAIVLVHHTPKQAGGRRSVVDAGAGAGAYARRVDTCLVVREEEPDPPERGEPPPPPTGRHVLEARTRSCAPIGAITIGWRGQRGYDETER